MDANGLAAIITAVILGTIGAVKGYPVMMTRFGTSETTSGPDKPKPKPTIKTLNERVETLETELREAYKDRDEAYTERDKTREEIGKLRSDSEASFKDIQGQLNSLKLKYDQAAIDLNQAQQENIRLLREYNEALQANKSISDELNDVEIKVQSLTVQLLAQKSLAQMVDELGTKLGPVLVGAIQSAIKSTSETNKVVTEQGINPS